MGGQIDMHIALFVDYHLSAIGGVASSVASQAEALESTGHTVTIVSPPSSEKGVASKFATIELPAVPFVRPNDFPMVIPGKRTDDMLEAGLRKRPSIDIVHVQTNLGVGITGVRYARSHGLPLVQTMHGRDDVFAETTYRLPYLMTFISRMAHKRYVPHVSHAALETDSRTARNAWSVMINHARAADHVVFPSKHFADKFKQRGLDMPMSVISNGIRKPLLDRLRSSRKKKYAPHSPLRLVWIGRMSAEKRPLETIRAVAKLQNVSLDLYGDGPLTKEAREYVEAHGLNRKIKLMGKKTQDEIVSQLVDYDLLVYPSYGFDNQPMVLLETTAAGVPVVYCDPDLAECMPDAGALLTRTPDSKDLRNAIKSLAADHGRLRRMHAAMEAASESISQEVATRQLISLYQNLVARR